MAGQSVIRPESDLQRIGQWKTALAAFRDHPVLGVGYMNFEPLCSSIKEKYNIPPANFCGHAHNNFLEMLATTGLWVYFVLFLGLFYGV